MSLFYGHYCYEISYTGIMIAFYQQYLHKNESNCIKVDDSIDFLWEPETKLCPIKDILSVLSGVRGVGSLYDGLRAGLVLRRSISQK